MKAIEVLKKPKKHDYVALRPFKFNNELINKGQHVKVKDKEILHLLIKNGFII